MALGNKINVRERNFFLHGTYDQDVLTKVVVKILIGVDNVKNCARFFGVKYQRGTCIKPVFWPPSEAKI